jgi:hypothetical protein
LLAYRLLLARYNLHAQRGNNTNQKKGWRMASLSKKYRSLESGVIAATLCSLSIGSMACQREEPASVPAGELGDTVTALTNLGKAFWQVMQAAEPVVTSSGDFASAVPSGASWSDLSGFSDPVSRTITFFGDGVKVDYTLIHQYNGSFHGEGAYLNNVTALTNARPDCNFCSVDIDAKVGNITNVGVLAPVASLVLTLTIKVKFALDTYTATRSYEFRGDSSAVVEL